MHLQWAAQLHAYGLCADALLYSQQMPIHILFAVKTNPDYANEREQTRTNILLQCGCTNIIHI